LRIMQNYESIKQIIVNENNFATMLQISIFVFYEDIN